MTPVTVRDMEASDEYYAATCGHVNESDEIDACAQRRTVWFRDKYEAGLRVKIAVLDGVQAGALFVMPIDICPWGPLGQDLMVIPCLFVSQNGQGVGRALIAEAEKETRRQGRKGLVTMAFYHDFWFMPASFFERWGFSVAKRKGEAAILWKVFDASAQAPQFLKQNYPFESVTGKVVVDLFWNTFCETSDIEAQRVREVAKEFGESVMLREHSADDRPALLCHQTPRGIFVNGEEIGWGYEAPREGIRDAISQALLRT
jgi:thiol-disulfide isomerase/thioredoxin